MTSNATNQQIHDLLNRGLSNNRISAQLHCGKARVANLRRIYAVPDAPTQPLTLEEKWRANTRQVEGGHLHWDGERQSQSGTPVLQYCGKDYSAAAIAFRIRTGRDAQGYAYADCDYHQCVAQEHVDDTPGRMQAREERRRLSGLPDRPAECIHGHDQAQHGRYEVGGRAYCQACKRRERSAAAPVAAGV
jgi:hypothetical protein